MDDIVKAALRKWPNVPHCHGWLALDARGDWHMRDERAQAAGPFPQVKGSRVVHDKLREFIHRNYLPDEAGAWFFQNGPQRVYVELELAPLVMRVWPAEPGQAPRLETHTGRPAQLLRPDAVWLSDEGQVLLESDQGPAVVHPQDMLPVAEAIEHGLWQPQTLAAAQWPGRFGYQLKPQP